MMLGRNARSMLEALKQLDPRNVRLPLGSRTILISTETMRFEFCKAFSNLLISARMQIIDPGGQLEFGQVRSSCQKPVQLQTEVAKPRRINMGRQNKSLPCRQTKKDKHG